MQCFKHIVKIYSMMFKQLPIIISELNKLGISLKTLGGMNIAAVGVNTGNIDAFRSAIKGLSIEQAVFALASKGATEEQIRQILITKQSEAADVEAALAKAGLTTATSALTQAEMVELATKTGVAKADAEALLSKIGITAAEEGQVAVKHQVTMAMLEQAVANGTLTSAESAQIATMLGLNAAETANIGITNILTGAVAKLWAVITAHPIGAILTAVGAVAVGVISYINKSTKDAQKALVKTHEKAQQALDDTKTALSNDKSELESVNSELDSTRKKIQDIASQDNITLTEQNELDKLLTANIQLETQKSLLENNIRLKQKSAALDAKKLLGTQVEMDYSNIQDDKDIVSHKESYTYAEHAKYEASSLESAYSIYMNALKTGNAEKQKLAQELIDKAGGDTAELTSSLLEIVESFKYDDGTIIEGYKDLYNQYMGFIYNLQSLTNPKMFLDIAKQATEGTNIDYEKAISDGYAMVYDGEFDIDKLNQDFVKALADNGIKESTIEYIFKLKQREYQSIVDNINKKYNPDNVLRPTYLTEPGHVDTKEETAQKQLDSQNYEQQKQEVQNINDELTKYAKEHPIEFQLISSYDENFSTLNKYIEEEKSKSESAIQDTKSQLEDLSKNGNVDLTIRPVIDSSAMQAAGWDVEDGSIATTFTQGEFIWQGDEENGQYVYVHYTPISPDGKVMTPEEMADYLYNQLEGAQNILDADDKGLVLKVDTDLRGISEDDIKALQEENLVSSDMKNFLEKSGQWDNAVHDVQQSYYGVGDSIDYVDKAINKTIKDAKKSSYDSTSPTTFSDMFIVADDNDSTKTELIESYQKLFTNIENVKTAFQTLKSAQEEYNTSGSLSIDTIKSLMETGDDWLNYLTVEDGQLKINEQGYVDLAKAKLNALKTEMYTSIQKQIEGLQNAGQANDWVNEQNGNLANSYDDLTSSIKASTLATLENKLATADDDAEKQKWQSAIESAKNAFDKIDKLVNDQNPIETGVTVTGSDSEFSNRINQIKEHASLINSISDDIKDKGKITMDTLTSISSAFPKLESYIEDYMNGVEGSQEALTNALKECYEQDLENYKEYLKVKYTNDSSFWQQYVNNCGDSINQLANQYGIDLKNYSTYTEAMQVMNNKLIESNEAVANARRLAMNLMTGTTTSSATVAGLNSTQKTAIDNVWQQLVNEYSSGQVSEDSYSTIEQRLLNLNLGINQNIAKNLAAQFRQQLVHLPKSTILDSLKTEVESGFDGYVANYVDNFDLSSLSLDSLKEDSSSSKEDFDWVETKINRLSEALERLKDKASDTYSTWSTRNASLQQAIATTQNAIDLQSQAYQTYMNKANSIGLSDTYKTLVQNGALRIDTIYDEDLKEKISDYQEWYDKAKDCLDTQRDLQDSLNELNSQKFENLQSEYDSLIESLEKQRDLLEGQITVLTSASTYNQLRNQQNNIIENLKAERNALSATLNSLSITRGSEEWTNLSSELTDIDQSLQDAYSKLQEISKLQFDNLKEYYELSIDLAEKQKDLAEGRINLLSSSSDYQNLANQQRSIIQMYEQELNQLNALKNSSVFNEMSYSDQMGTLSDLTDLNQTLDEAYDTLREISKLQFDNVKETFEFDTQKIEHYLQLLQDQTDLLETKGLFANEKYYNSMISYTQQKIDNLQKEKSQLQSILNNSSYQQGTSEWNDMFSALMDIDEELSSLNADMVEFNNNIRDLNWDIFEYLEESLSRITSETDYLVELLSKEDLYDKDTGEFTKYADATVGLHAAAYDVYKQQAQDYYEEVQDLQKQLVNGAGKDVLEQYNNMVDAHQDAVKSALEEKQAILDLIEQGYNAQLDALQELIDKKKEALNQEKNLHDYQKNVKDKTENIASLEKQKASLLNDASEDAMSKIQKIEASLKDAREDLQETEYEQYLQDSQDMLDQLAEDYEDWMNARLDQSDALLAEIVGKVGEQGGEIKNTLTEVADRNGTMLSESMNTIFSAESPFTSSLMNGIRDTSNNTVGAVNNLNTNVNNGINNINGNVTNGFTDVGNKISGTTTAINNLINKVADITNAVAKNTNAGSNTGGGNGGASGNTTSSGGSYSSTPSTPNYTPSYTPTHTTSNSGSSSGSNSSSNSGSSNNNSSNSSSGSGIFEYLKDSYPKDRLDINNSIVDRLKYRDYNSTFSARSRYWQKLGFSGTYTGSSAQNTKMLNWMKNHGYRKGTDYVPKNGYYPTQEEGLEVIEHNGALLTPLSKGDKVFNSEATQRLFDIANNEEFQKNVKLFTPSIDLTSGLKSVQSINANNGGNRTITFGDTNVSIAQASNIEDIVDGLTKSKRFEDMICYVINEKSMGRSTVGKNRFVRH